MIFLGFYKKKMGSTARPRYIGLREISERDILELYCSAQMIIKQASQQMGIITVFSTLD